MMRTSIAIAAAAALAVSAGAAEAADLYTPPPVEPAPVYVPPPFTWTGFYVGLQAGYQFAGEHTVFTPGGPPPADLDPDGFVGGAHAGFNYQWGSIVLGIEGDVEFSGVEGDAVYNGLAFAVEGNWQGSVRARIGYAFDRLLIYGTGGWAFGSFDYAAVPAAAGGVSDDATHNGYTVGGGVEYAMTDHITARIEYRYTDFDDEKLFPGFGGAPYYNFNPDNHAVRVGVSYKF